MLGTIPKIVSSCLNSFILGFSGIDIDGGETDKEVSVFWGISGAKPWISSSFGKDSSSRTELLFISTSWL